MGRSQRVSSCCFCLLRSPNNSHNDGSFPVQGDTVLKSWQSFLSLGKWLHHLLIFQSFGWSSWPWSRILQKAPVWFSGSRFLSYLRSPDVLPVWARSQAEESSVDRKGVRPGCMKNGKVYKLVMPILTLLGIPAHTAVGISLFDSIAIACIKLFL